MSQPGPDGDQPRDCQILRRGDADPHQDRSVTGIADASVLQLLGEPLLLPEEMPARQRDAMSALASVQGSRCQQKTGFSRAGNHRLHTAFYMPALSAVRHDPIEQQL